MEFKTNIRCTGCLEKAGPALDATAGPGQWSVNLQDPDRTLTVIEPVANISQIKKALRKAGFSAEPKN